ncbi:MAG: glycosyltransferase family 1 protein [Alphaproteobacteria bacterium]|nr:MAG: glycosyltransferase family 1 protein [Alphaproteobacteria bacterium]
MVTEATANVSHFREELEQTSERPKRPLPAPDAPLKILLPSYRSHPFTGGQGVYMRHVSKALVDMGHQVDVISGPPYPDLDPRVKLIKLPSLDLYEREKNRFGFPNPPFKDMKTWIDVYEYIAHVSGAFPEPYTFGERLYEYMKDKIHEYDVVHDNQTLCWGLVKVKNLGLPVAGTIHHPITMDKRIAVAAAESLKLKLLVRRWYSFLRMQKKVARLLDPIIVVSESTRRDVSVDFKVPIDRMITVHHGINLAQWHPLEGIDRETNRLIAVASADVPLKGLIYLIEAYALLLKTHPDLKLTVIGKLREGPTKKRLIKLGILDKVEFLSGLSDDDITELYAKSTIAITPSVYEGFGFPVGEAMACGIPVVSTTGGSLPEVVGDAGLLVPPKDPEALAGAIDKLLGDPELRDKLGAAGRERIVTQFDWAHTAQKVTRIYRRAIEYAHNGSR